MDWAKTRKPPKNAASAAAMTTPTMRRQAPAREACNPVLGSRAVTSGDGSTGG
jgi:hypothetical protein